MPVEIEVPTEHLHEAIHEAHHESQGHGDPHAQHHASFTLGVALSSALLAVLAAMAALFAGHYANDAMLERIEAGDQWSYYQAKGIKASVLTTRISTMEALSRPVDEKDRKKLEKYSDDQKKIEEKANELSEESEAHLTQHTRLAGSVTFFQIAIALGAIAVLTKKRPLWMGSLAVGVAGVVAMGYGFSKPARLVQETEEKEHGSGSAHHDHSEQGHHDEHGAAPGEHHDEHSAAPGEHHDEAKPGEHASEVKPGEHPAEVKPAEHPAEVAPPLH